MFFRRTFERLAKTITTEFRTMTQALDAVAAKITNLETKVDAAVAAQTEAVTELKSLRADLASALAGNDSAALAALGDRIDAIAGKLDTSSSALAAAEIPAAPAPAAEPTPAPADLSVPTTTP